MAESSPFVQNGSPLAFSVVITTYNRAHLLPRAIDSVLAQSFSDFELLIVDDASQDHTPDAVMAYCDPRIRYLRQDENRGVSHARNCGYLNARGEFIVYLDDDDTFDPAFLHEVHAALSQAPAKVGFMWTWKEVVRETEDGLVQLMQLRYNSTSAAPRSGEQLLRKVVGGTGGLVVRRAALDQVGGFNLEFQVTEDTELIIRLASQFDYMILPRTLYRIYAAHGARLTTPSVARAEAHERIIELHYDLLKQYPETLRVQYLGCTRLYYLLGERAKARHCAKKLLQFSPWNWKNWVILLLLENLRFLPRNVARRVTRDYSVWY